MNTNPMFINSLARIATLLPAFLIAISFHEFAHALVATFFGDDTAKRMGRLTLNPFKHLDFLGTIFLFVFGIGWARPVSFDEDNFKRPRLYSALVALAGPFANFVMAYMFLYVLKYFPYGLLPYAAAISFFSVFKAIVSVNVMLGVFNLFPLPPLDGSHLLYAILPDSLHELYWFISRYAFFILFLMFYIPSFMHGFGIAIDFVTNFLTSIVI